MKVIDDQYSDLKKVATSQKHQYREAAPFPHIVFRDFFDRNLIEKVWSEFPDLAQDETLKKFSKNSRKYGSKGETLFGDCTKLLWHFVNSHSFLEFLQELTSVERTLIPDPYIIGGGLHEIKNGGFLDVHADFNKHHKTGLDRRLNLLIYLNKDWPEENGGQLELWDKEMKQCKVSIAPTFNTVVVFSTTSDSYHGHPEPVTCNTGESRKSVALYYYTNGRPEDEIDPDQVSHSTLYQQKKGSIKNLSAKKIIKSITPPVIFDFVKKVTKS